MPQVPYKHNTSKAKIITSSSKLVFLLVKDLKVNSKSKLESCFIFDSFSLSLRAVLFHLSISEMSSKPISLLISATFALVQILITYMYFQPLPSPIYPAAIII